MPVKDNAPEEIKNSQSLPPVKIIFLFTYNTYNNVFRKAEILRQTFFMV